MLRAVGLLVSLPAVVVGLFAANFSGTLSFAGTALGIVAIVGFAMLATRWTEDHDVSD